MGRSTAHSDERCAFKQDLWREGFVFGGFFFVWRLFVLAQERKKQATRTWRESGTLSPQRSAGLQNPKALQRVLGCKPASPKQSVGLQHPKALKGVLGCKTVSPKRSVGLQNPELLGIGMVRVLFRPTRPEDTSPAAMALRSKLAKALAPAQVEAWVTAMMPMTDAIQEGLRDCSGDFKQSLETVSEQIGNLFQVHTAKFHYVAEANEGVREAIVQVAATMTLLEPLRDLAQPLHDLVKPLQALVSQLKTVFSEAMAPCNKNLVLLQKKVEEELAKTVTQVTELLEQTKTSFATVAEGEFKKVIEHIDWKVMSKLQGMANASSERFGRVESQQAEQTALIKSHTGLLSSFRTTLAEFGEGHKTNLQGVQDLAEDIGRMGERLAENTEALQQTKEAIGQLSDSLQVLREAVMRGMPPYRPPPRAASPEGGIPIRLDEAIRAASSRGPHMMYSVGSTEGQPATINTNVLLLRILEQMVPGQHIVTRGGRQ